MDNTNKVIHASRIGHPCDRHLFYHVIGAEEVISIKSSRILELGRILEPVIMRWLRSDGLKVRRNLFTHSNEGMSLTLNVSGGTIQAHPDCVLEDEDGSIILADIKTMNDRSFRSLKRDGTVKSHPQYADQLTIYAQALRLHGYEINKLAIVSLNKNDCSGYIDFFPFDQERFEILKERAERILACTEAPAQGDNFKNWCCSYCGYSHICELAKKDTSVGTEDVQATDNQEVINAVELLSESRDMEKAAKELSDDAKAVLDKLIRQKGIKSVRAGNLILVLNEIKSSRLDTIALKKAHPELVSEFMKLSSSVRYDLKEVA